MLTHEIKKPEEPRQPFRHVREIISNIIGGRATPQAREISTHGGVEYMSKTGYAMWIEGEVKPRFPINSYCALRNSAFVPGRLPVVVFQVLDVQEVHWMSPMNPNWNEPSALYVRNTQNNVTGKMCPSALRPLQQEETLLAYARNKATQESRDAKESGTTDDSNEPDPVG